MSTSKVWFGNREKQAWIPAPQAGLEWSLVKRTNLIQLEGGGAYVDDSRASHREASPEWTGTPADLRIVKEFEHGVWGPGPYFLTDPYAADINLLAPWWATPGITVEGDWPQIHSSDPVAATTATGALSLPTRAVVHTPVNLHSDALPAERFTILIPPGYQLAFGAHGSRTGAGVVAVRGTTAAGSVVTSTFIPLDPAGNTVYSSSTLFPHSSGYRVVDIFLARASATASTITLSGIRARLVREGSFIPTSGTPFASGEGVAGLAFSGNLRETPEYIGHGASPTTRRKRLSVKLVEQW